VSGVIGSTIAIRVVPRRLLAPVTKTFFMLIGWFNHFRIKPENPGTVEIG
jgi:hypothetical protein